MMTKCTMPTLHRRQGRGDSVPERVRHRRTARHTVSVVSSPGRVVKRVILGRAMRSDRLGETLLPKKLALPVFASDALSSVAYAPDEILLTLGLGGGALALTHSWKIALAVIVVMARRHHELPPERARLPLRRRRLRGGQRQPRPEGRAHRGECAARRLRAHRRGLGVRRRAERGIRLRVPARQGGDRRGAHRRDPHRDEPARGARVRRGLRGAHLPVHVQRHRDGAVRLLPAGLRRPAAGRERPHAAAPRVRATRRSAASPWPSSCSGPSPRAARP